MAIEKNQKVSMFYELKVNGEVIDSNIGKKPIEFKYGSGDIISGLEDRIATMSEGETKEILVPAYEGYGEYDKEETETLPIEDFDGIDLEIGLVLESDMEDGEVLRATVTEVTKDSVTVDYNHPLAGQDLLFTVTIDKIK